MDFIQVLLSLWHQLALSLGSDFMAVLVVAGFAIVMVAVWFAVAAFRRTEFYKQNQALINLVSGKLTDMIFLVATGSVDLTEWEQLADDRASAGLPYIDPRMLYVLSQVQLWAKSRFGVTLDLDDLWSRAEHIYDEVRNDPSNSVEGGTPPAPPVAPPSAS